LDFAAKVIFRIGLEKKLVLDGQDFGHIVVAHRRRKFGIAVRKPFSMPFFGLRNARNERLHRRVSNSPARP